MPFPGASPLPLEMARTRKAKRTLSSMLAEKSQLAVTELALSLYVDSFALAASSPEQQPDWVGVHLGVPT